MTKGELIKALQDAPFGDDAVVTIGHNYDAGVLIDANQQLDIKHIVVWDENELSISLIPESHTYILIKHEQLYGKA